MILNRLSCIFAVCLSAIVLLLLLAGAYLLMVFGAYLVGTVAAVAGLCWCYIVGACEWELLWNAHTDPYNTRPVNTMDHVAAHLRSKGWTVTKVVPVNDDVTVDNKSFSHSDY